MVENNEAIKINNTYNASERSPALTALDDDEKMRHAIKSSADNLDKFDLCLNSGKDTFENPNNIDEDKVCKWSLFQMHASCNKHHSTQIV